MSDSELAELRKQCIRSLYLCTDNISNYLDSEKEAEFNKLKSYVEGYCLLEAQQDVAIQALEKAKNDTDLSNIDELQDRFTENLSSLTGKRLNVNRHPFMLELTKRIKKGLQSTKQNIDESDLAITETQEQYIDPITKRPIVDPMKNTVCGHIYDKEAIINLINMKSKTRCPVAGCGNKNPIKMDDLVVDEELKFRLAITQHSTMVEERSVMNLDETT